MTDTDPITAPHITTALMTAIRRNPHNVAVACGRAIHTYADLDTLSETMAGALTERGVETGAVVAIVSTRSWLRCAAVLAVWRIGAAVLSLDPDMPRARVDLILASSAPALVIRDDTIPTADYGGVRSCVFADLQHRTAASPEADPVAGPSMYVVSTSGSTGDPKSIAMPAVVLSDLGAWHVSHWKYDVLPHTLHAASVGFDVGIEELVATWLAGATVVVVTDDERRDPFALADLVVMHDVARLFLPVPSLHGLAMVALHDDVRLTSLREITVAGEQLVINDEVRRFCARDGLALVNEYGPSETHAVTQYRMPPDPRQWVDCPPIGGPIVSAELLCCISGELRPFQDGEIHELVVAGDCLASGYLGDEALTSEKFRTLPHMDGRSRRCYFTGDRVTLKGSEYHYVGRVDDQLKVKGFRVEPGDVEAALARIDGVRSATVLGVDGNGTVLLAAFYVREHGSAITTDNVRAACLRDLPEYMVPTHLHEVETMPVTANGKVDRRKCAEILARMVARPRQDGALVP